VFIHRLQTGTIPVKHSSQHPIRFAIRFRTGRAVGRNKISRRCRDMLREKERFGPMRSACKPSFHGCRSAFCRKARLSDPGLTVMCPMRGTTIAGAGFRSNNRHGVMSCARRAISPEACARMRQGKHERFGSGAVAALLAKGSRCRRTLRG
jgi:hypothetical protein